MKRFNFLYSSLLIICINFVSCGKDDNTNDSNPTEGLSTEKQILSFIFQPQNIEGIIDEENKTITATIPYSSSTILTPSITISENATISPSSNTEQDFSEDVIYTITAEDKSHLNYTVKVIKDRFNQNGITMKELTPLPEESVTAAFTVNGKGYAITENSHLYEYNVSTNSWTQKADFPGEDRSLAYAYNIGDLGYFGFGRNSAMTETKDLWAYDPANDSWSELTISNEIAVNGIFKESATAMLIDDVIYAGNGASSEIFAGTVTSDISIDWQEVSTYPVSEPSTPIFFSIDGIGYWGGHYLGNNVYSTKFYKYTPDNNVWEPLNDLPDEYFRTSVSYTFTLGSYAFTLGNDKIWKYTPSLDTWTSTVFINSPYHGYKASFIINDTAYLLFSDSTVYSFKEN